MHFSACGLCLVTHFSFYFILEHFNQIWMAGVSTRYVTWEKLDRQLRKCFKWCIEICAENKFIGDSSRLVPAVHAEHGNEDKQVVKVICHKAASQPHTDGSIVFARWRQCTPHLVHPNRHLHRTDAAPWVYRPPDMSGMSWAGPFSPSKLPLDLDSHYNMVSWAHPSQKCRSVQPFLQGSLTVVSDLQTHRRQITLLLHL